MSTQIPVTVLTGFLGSGKTSALNRLLKQPALRDTAVIINEFGEVGLDHHLIETSDERFVLLANGCICCTVRGDLVATFAALADGARAVRRVIVETTGLADPAPILHTLMSEPAVTTRYRLQNVVATVDAVNAMGTLDRHPEAVKQVAVADRLLLTKTDLVPAVQVRTLIARLREINPTARIVTVDEALAHAAGLFDGGDFDPQAQSPDVRHWLNVEALEAPRAEEHGHGHGHEHGHRHASGRTDGGHAHAASAHHHDRNRHDDHIRAYAIVRDTPITWAGLQAWLDMLATMRGDDLLRVKGIIHVVEHPDRPVVIHGVQHVFHPPAFLPRWPDADRRTRIVFITRDIDRDTLDDTLRIFENKRARRPPPPPG